MVLFKRTEEYLTKEVREYRRQLPEQDDLGLAGSTELEKVRNYENRAEIAQRLYYSNDRPTKYGTRIDCQIKFGMDKGNRIYKNERRKRAIAIRANFQAAAKYYEKAYYKQYPERRLRNVIKNRICNWLKSI
ncbi:MAG: hypothetical protein FWE93_00340 [Alphaproteobacteria bacterium]|nr:hypothetical protein [Alphaproteobacteria bacterium]